MMSASIGNADALSMALPIKGNACFNPLMLEGEDLAQAIRTAVERKRRQPGKSDYGPTALGRALGISQPSASELLKTGRIAKSRLPLLWQEFADVADPAHWGLPAVWGPAAGSGSAAPAESTAGKVNDDLAMAAVLRAVAGMSPMKWAAVRAQLDVLAGHPEMVDDAMAELRHVLRPTSTKRHANGKQ